MPNEKIFKISTGLAGQRLDRVLPILTGLSRKKVKRLIDGGRIFIGKKRVLIASWQLKSGDQIKIKPEGDFEISAKDSFLKIIHEDSDLLVVEKEAGIACEATPQSTRPTLVSIINAYFKRKYPNRKGHYLGLIHRLDKGTSGIMVYSKSKEGNTLSEQFKNHKIRRKYLAVVEGEIAGERGNIKGFLEKSDLLPGGQKVKISNSVSGRQAITTFQVLERYQKGTVVDITLNTGRTHQIRVHMASIGHPVIGDRVYELTTHDARRTTVFKRPALHAYYLAFRHPVTREKMEFESELPKDMEKLVEKLQGS